MKKVQKETNEKRQNNLLPILLIAVSGIIFLLALIQMASYGLKTRQEAALDKETRDFRQQEEIAFDKANMGLQKDRESDTIAATDEQAKAGHLKEEFLKINEDYVAWLEILGSDIAYPVVQRDNAYYLSHDFRQKESSHGTIFLDEACTQETVVWLIHGHHMKDGSMFGSLKQYKKEEYREEHRTILLDTGEGNVSYRIFAAALIDFSKETEENEAFHYEKLPQKKETFQEYVKELKKNAFWYDNTMEEELTNVAEHLSGKKMIILSTCEYGTALQRLILVAVRVD